MTIHWQFIHSIHDIDATSWDTLWQTDYPFVQHRFFAALEDSGCTSKSSGWEPHHLIGVDNQQLVFAMPLYRKSHSWGEYVFDWAWADAYQRNGLAYYPKLVNSIPFTPATGPRWATPKAYDKISTLQHALTFIKEYAHEHLISGIHHLFMDASTSNQIQQLGLQQRQGCQFHWFNRDYSDFNDFLTTFSSRKRKNLRKERLGVTNQGVTLKRLTGLDITEEDWKTFYRFYHMTYLKRSGSTGYLNEQFFSALSAALNDHLMMVVAYQSDQRIAASLCLFDSDTLYGRYWGCSTDIPGLHFEACYYQGIEFAIEKGMQRFDPGAQGEHKIQRGFEPILTYSNHWLAEPAFNNAITQFLAEEKSHIEDYQRQCTELLPFKHTP